MAAVRVSEGVMLTCLRDGGSVLDADVFPGLPDDRRAGMLATAGETEIRTAFNCFLLRGPDGAVTLVDCGAGTMFGPVAGAVPDLLAAQGIAPGDVTRLIFTHLHTDHCGAALTGDGKPVFVRAEVVVQAAEVAYWQGKDHHAARVLSAYAPQLRVIEGAEGIAPGIVAWPLPGHTPGHMGLGLGEGAAVVGDILHAEHLQLPDPGIACEYDVDADQARHSRIAALRLAADRGLVLAGGHLLDGIIRVAREGDGFRRVPL